METLNRFVDAQEPVYATVCAELAAGCKRTHWMWFVFPQLRGLGRSPMAWRFGIASRAEAAAYLVHPLLGARLSDCTRLILRHRDRSAHAIFGSPDDLKLHSCLTLFAQVAGAADGAFGPALTAFFAGRSDRATLDLLDREPSG